MCFAVYFDETSWIPSTAYLSLCQGGNSWLEPFRFHVNCIHFCGAVVVHVGSAQLCTENGVSFYMHSAVEVEWLAQNIRKRNTRV